MAEDEHLRTPEEEARLLGHLEEQIRRMSVADHLAYMLESLAALATRKLGLTTDTQAERDLDQARLAIDAFRALLPVVEPARPAHEVAAHRGMLSQLQLAFVTATQAPVGASAADDSGGAAADFGDDSGGESDGAPSEGAEADCEPPAAVTGDNLAASEEGALPLED
jgi:hypothetical protein